MKRAIPLTVMVLRQDPEFLKMILSKIPRVRMLEPTEAASIICWLASDLLRVQVREREERMELSVPSWPLPQITRM